MSTVKAPKTGKDGPDLFSSKAAILGDGISGADQHTELYGCLAS